MKKIALICVSIFLCSSIALAQELSVAVAANMQFAFEEIVEKYESQTHVKIVPVYNSSGKLTAQIENGAPFDLFISADIKYPQSLFEKGFAVQEPKIYAYGILVLWGMGEINSDFGIKMLKDESVKKIALANPETAPYGIQAVNAMKKAGVYDAVNDKFVFGESISQVNQFITTAAADVGFTAKSIVMAPDMQSRGKWIEVDPNLYDAIAQGVVILKKSQGTNAQAAQEFYNYLFSDEAKAILTRYGYKLP